MNWVCDIPGASPTVSALHLALHLGLAAFVVIGGAVFLGLAVVAYRRPLEPIAAVTGTDTLRPDLERRR